MLIEKKLSLNLYQTWCDKEGSFERIKGVAVPVCHQDVPEDGVELLLVVAGRHLVPEQSAGLVGPGEEDGGRGFVLGVHHVSDHAQTPLSQISAMKHVLLLAYYIIITMYHMLNEPF